MSVGLIPCRRRAESLGDALHCQKGVAPRIQHIIERRPAASHRVSYRTTSEIIPKARAEVPGGWLGENWMNGRGVSELLTCVSCACHSLLFSAVWSSGACPHGLLTCKGCVNSGAYPSRGLPIMQPRKTQHSFLVCSSRGSRTLCTVVLPEASGC
jgi:hypothetical protein